MAELSVPAPTLRTSHPSVRTASTPRSWSWPRLAPSRAWPYVGAVLGAGVSIGANVLHSYVPPDGAPEGWQPHAGAVLGAMFWPLAVLVAVEILTRVDWPDERRWTLLRWGGLAPVALAAAIVSYRHMSGLLAFWGEDAVTVIVGPLAVDGLMVLASGALLVEPSRRRRAVRHAPVRQPAPVASAAPTPQVAPAVAPSVVRQVTAARRANANGEHRAKAQRMHDDGAEASAAKARLMADGAAESTARRIVRETWQGQQS